MNNFFIIIPVFNDWESLNKLLINLNQSINRLKGIFRIIVINDYSSEKINLKTKNLNNIKTIKVLNLKRNVGSQKAIFIALKYIQKIKYKSIVSILDADGEDDPQKLRQLIYLSLKKKSCVYVANRSVRTENTLLKFFNHVRLIFTFFLTGKYINFGNFSSFSSQNIKEILSNNNLWLAYSSGLLKNCRKIKLVNIKKKKRYFGKSKVNLKFLLNHTIKIICVFRKEIFIRSVIVITFLMFVFKNQFIELNLIIFFLLLNVFINAYYLVHSLSFDALKLIKNTNNLKNN